MILTEALESLTTADLKNLLALVPGNPRATRKGDMVAAITQALLGAGLRPVWERLSDFETQAVAETVHNWRGAFSAERFQARYGALPRCLDPDRRDTYVRFGAERTPEPPSLLPLFFYRGLVPDDLIPRLAELAPPPAPLPIATLGDDELPEALPSETKSEAPESLRRLAGEVLVHQDLPAVLRLVGQGAVAVGPKTGAPSAAAQGRLEGVLLGGDWYPPADDRGLANWAGGPIRPIRTFAWPFLLKAGGLAKIDGTKLALTPAGNKALSQPVAQTVAHLFRAWQSKGSPDELRRVELIKGQTAKGCRLSPPAERRAAIARGLTACAPPGRWIAIDELFRQFLYRGHRFQVTENTHLLYLADPNYGSLAYGNDGFEILEARYILAYLFEYLATLGLIDVAYTLPYHARPDFHDAWGTDELAFLSRYDGLRYIRLNGLGAFCLGLVADYTPTLAPRPALFTARADLGFDLLREPDAGERLALEGISRPVSARTRELDPDAMLRASADPPERERIRDFLRSAAEGELPPEWVHLLASIAERSTALTDGGPARLIKCRDPGTAAMLAADPATAACCTRAGERLICVPESKLAAFRKGLAKLGLVLPETERG